jgi:hypothetical protein
MKPKVTTHQYFDMASFMQTQIATLEKSTYTVRKNTTANGISDKSVAEKIDWKQELAIFAEVDINKPVLKDMYLARYGKNFVEYEAIEKNAKVQRLYVAGGKDAPTQIKVSWIDENQLYQSKKDLEIVLQNNKITKYGIIGEQKIIFKEPLQYTILGEILYK